MLRSNAAKTSEPQSSSQDQTALVTQLLQLPDYCAGCGVKLQSEDPDRPGYYKVPQKLIEASLSKVVAPTEQQDAHDEGSDDIEERRASNAAATSSGNDDLPLGAAEELRAFDALVDSWLDEKDDEDPKAALQRLNIAPERDDGDEAHILCARCYSLSHYGQVKNARAEADLPQFDLGQKVGRKIGLQRSRRAVVLCVVDAADFDGSLPRTALQALFSNIEGYQVRDGVTAPRAGDKDVRFVLAVNKADLLPAQATASRLEKWIRARARQGGIPRPVSVELVSALKGWGVEELLVHLHREVGATGDVWVVGAQNAGKSSLINAMKRAVRHGKPRNELTTAALPGTTLGMLKVPGLMPPRCNMFDTPGVPHNFQLSSRLSPEEVKMLLPKRRLKPRTFRAAEGQTVFVGAVARIDVHSSPGATLYLTVWASDEITCHFGKTEGAEERYDKNLGTLLAPPLDSNHKLGPLVPTPVIVQGTNWKQSSMDIAVAGLGWIAVGVSGEAQFTVWAHEGVAITTRTAVLPDYAKELERPGFGNKDRKLKAKAGSKARK
ncbi:g3603 [Coccomyxa elongata]